VTSPQHSPNPTELFTLTPTKTTPVAPAVPDTKELDDQHRRYLNRRKQGGATPRQDEESARPAAIRNAEAVTCASDFLERLLRLNPGSINVITDAEDKYLHGELRLPSGATICVTRDSINPDRYPLNYVEVGELAFHPRHPNGLSEVATMLDLTLDDLINVSIRDFRQEAQPVIPLGFPEFFIPSITAILGSRATLYVNAPEGHIYIYPREDLTAAIRKAILHNNMRRGQAQNADALAVLIPLPVLRFRRDKKNLWRFEGPGKAEAHLPALRSLLN
jgi:hypothetical protein